MKYKVIEKHKEGQNEFDDIIEISGVTTTITINQLLDHLENTQKVLKEQKGQIEVNLIQMDLAEKELPVLKDIPQDKAMLALSYFGKKEAIKQARDLIKTCKATIETYKEHIKQIEKSTGIKCISVTDALESPEFKVEHKKNG